MVIAIVMRFVRCMVVMGCRFKMLGGFGVVIVFAHDDSNGKTSILTNLLKVKIKTDQSLFHSIFDRSDGSVL